MKVIVSNSTAQAGTCRAEFLGPFPGGFRILLRMETPQPF